MTNKITNYKTLNRPIIFDLYRPLFFILLLCGYDLKFFKKNALISVIVKVYCFCLVLIVMYASIYCCTEDGSQFWSLIEYTLSIILLLFSNSRLSTFFERLIDIDMYLRIKKRHYYINQYKLIIFTVITWTVRATYTVLYCNLSTCFDVLPLFVIRQLSLLALDLNRVWRCIVFDSIRYRLKMLRIRLEETPECDYYLYVNNNKAMKENKMKLCLYLYRKIADMVDLISPELHASLFLSVAGSLPKMISNVYNILQIIEGHVLHLKGHHETYTSLSYILMHVTQMCLLLFSPFVAVEFCSVEVEKMRLFLIHKFIDDDDSSPKEDIEKFLRYTEIRPFQYRIWRIIPINVAMPLELINICINYVIILINFTHLYG